MRLLSRTLLVITSLIAISVVVRLMVAVLRGDVDGTFALVLGTIQTLAMVAILHVIVRRSHDSTDREEKR